MRIEKSLIKHLTGIIIVILCSIGLFEQVLHVSNRYFEYKTKTLININVKGESEFPILSICFRYHDVMNRTRVKGKYRNLTLLKFNEQRYDSQIFFEQTKHFTISEYFQFSPDVKSILKPGIGCFIRYPGKIILNGMNTSMCYELFNISKYLILQNVCYMLKPIISNESIMLHEYTLSPGHKGQMFKLFLDQNVFKFFDSFYIAMHSNKSSILADTSFASNIRLKQENVPTISVFPQNILRHRLKVPYDTKCRDPPPGVTSMYDEKFNQIDKASMTRFNVSIPFYPSFDPNMNVSKVLNHRAFQNETLRRNMIGLVEKYSKYPTSSCYALNFMTRTQFFNDSGSSFAVYWTQDEYLISKYAPEQELLDYAVYVCSCIGIWFGLSAYSMLDTISRTFLPKSISEDRIDSILESSKNQEKIIASLSRQCNLLNRKFILMRRFNEQLYDFVR